MKLTLTIDPEVLSNLSTAGPEETIELTLSVRTDTPQARKKINLKVRPTGPLAALMRAGLLKSGDRLYFQQPRADRTAYATVRADGSLTVDGLPHRYRSPSQAASAVTGSVINGWTLWHRVGDDRRLDSLRDELGRTNELKISGKRPIDESSA
jgi:site-specific DNA-methyltransferase (adenine-specific)